MWKFQFSKTTVENTRCCSVFIRFVKCATAGQMTRSVKLRSIIYATFNITFYKKNENINFNHNTQLVRCDELWKNYEFYCDFNIFS